jgi:hypothetical protein
LIDNVNIFQFCLLTCLESGTTVFSFECDFYGDILFFQTGIDQTGDNDKPMIAL